MADLMKPRPWNVNPSLVHPDWGWFWENALLAVPAWERGGSTLTDHASGNVFDFTTTGGTPPSWEATLTGPAPYNNQTVVPFASASTTLAFKDPDRVTCIAKVSPHTATATRRSIFSPNNATGGLQLEITDSDKVSAFKNGFNIAVTSASVDETAPQVIIYTRNGTNPASNHIYINGLDQALTINNNTEFYSDVTDQLLFFARSTANNQVFEDVHLEMFAMLDGAITPEQVLQITRDPFGPFRIWDHAPLQIQTPYIPQPILQSPGIGRIMKPRPWVIR